jgi:hypothetical protein
MTTNKYINHESVIGEQRLIEDLSIEAIKIHGFDVYYVPRTTVNQDLILGEDPLSSFDDARMVEMYLENVDNLEGEGDLIAKLGLEIRDSATFVVAKRRFEELVTQAHAAITRPREGDLVYFPLTQHLFEIKFVEHRNPFYQLGKNYVYRLNVEAYQYSQETLATGVSDIDDIATDLENDNSVVNDPFANNTELETEADDGILSFEEGNPFGDY